MACWPNSPRSIVSLEKPRTTGLSLIRAASSTTSCPGWARLSSLAARLTTDP